MQVFIEHLLCARAARDARVSVMIKTERSYHEIHRVKGRQIINK